LLLDKLKGLGILWESMVEIFTCERDKTNQKEVTEEGEQGRASKYSLGMCTLKHLEVNRRLN